MVLQNLAVGEWLRQRHRFIGYTQEAQRGGGDARAQVDMGRYVPFQVGRDEGLAPAQAGGIVRRRPREGEAATHSKRVEVGDGSVVQQHFARLEGRQFQLRNPPGEAFARLLQQHAGCRAEQQELPGGLPARRRMSITPRSTAKSSGMRCTSSSTTSRLVD